MRPRWFIATFAAALAFAQEPARNPFARDAAAVAAGRAIYLERCAVCHGQDAKGGMAANLVLSGRVAQGPDAALFQVVSKGIPGTEMPPQPAMAPEDVWRIVSFLHSLARPGEQPPLPGDAERGAEVFRAAGCAGCHSVRGEGGFWGPALDSVAARRSSAEIRRSVVEPDAEIARGYRFVRATVRDGPAVEGLLKNDDMFTLQLLTRAGRYVSLRRADLTSIAISAGSPMPADAGKRLAPDELRDLFAFLDRLRDPYVTIERGFQTY